MFGTAFVAWRSSVFRIQATGTFPRCINQRRAAKVVWHAMSSHARWCCADQRAKRSRRLNQVASERFHPWPLNVQHRHWKACLDGKVFFAIKSAHKKPVLHHLSRERPRSAVVDRLKQVASERFHPWPLNVQHRHWKACLDGKVFFAIKSAHKKLVVHLLSRERPRRAVVGWSMSIATISIFARYFGIKIFWNKVNFTFASFQNLSATISSVALKTYLNLADLGTIGRLPAQILQGLFECKGLLPDKKHIFFFGERPRLPNTTQDGMRVQSRFGDWIRMSVRFQSPPSVKVFSFFAIKRAYRKWYASLSRKRPRFPRTTRDGMRVDWVTVFECLSAVAITDDRGKHQRLSNLRQEVVIGTNHSNDRVCSWEKVNRPFPSGRVKVSGFRWGSCSVQDLDINEVQWRVLLASPVVTWRDRLSTCCFYAWRPRKFCNWSTSRKLS